MFGCNGKWNFPEIHFPLTNIYSFDSEIILHSYFQFKSFPEREREREERAQIGERERGRRESRRSTRGAIVRRARRESRKSTSGAIVRWARSSIVPLVGRSHRSRLHHAISSFLPLRDLNLTGFDEFFCWVLFLLWMSVELIHYLYVYSWGSVWKIGHVKYFL